MLSIMVGSVTERLAPDVNFQQTNGTNITAEVDVTARDSYRVQVAAATAVLAGLIQVCKTGTSKKSITSHFVTTATLTHNH